MQRKAAVRGVLPGIAMFAALAVGAGALTGCTGGGKTGGGNDAKGGANQAAPAQPGKYRSLPAPCKAGVESKRLKGMLPIPDTLPAPQRDQLYAGVADASYDGDRHVGCRWSAQVPEETRLLSVVFERVVSYDRAAMSDDDKARQVYVRRLTDAHLPFPGPSASPTPAAPTPGAPTPPAPTAAAPGAPGAPSPGASTSPTASPSAPVELGSRVLEGLGSEAYIEDKLSPAGATAAQSRTVRIVFRTSNVIVTVEYAVQPALPGVVPPSGETQEKARQLAQALVERFNE
ncbi:DUF3558 domain-containing protein [Streptomyces sp. NBC_01351]|uniref:DUF3558 domain-containing protein n=1 Tax=Streptomyces sp. NBC_01351 TaxID=2903833 RepID=UPI002E33C298|nr:DUF3558 domain-containing protein [Streptomyces sp. NBC_01351]